MKNKLGRLNRRQMLKSMGLCAAGSSAGLGTLLASRRGVAQTPDDKPRFLIVIAAAGGASVIDSFMAIKASESQNAGGVNTFEDNAVTEFQNSPLRALDQSGSDAGAIPIAWTANQSSFVQKHMNDILVATCTGTSVNHNVAQRRSITGNEFWNGRTMQECVANQWGANFAIPNVNMAGAGYVENGNDKSLPSYAFNEPVANAAVWPLGLDGAAGIQDLPAKGLIERARALRDAKLDPESPFYKTFQNSKRLELWQHQRGESLRALEGSDLIKKLLFLPDSQQIPLSEYGLTAAPEAAAVLDKFPRFAEDEFQAQAALAFLLLKNRVSTTVTIGPSFNVVLDGLNEIYNPPLAYDYSHNAHRATQAIMWSRLLAAADSLIELLKAEEFEDGESFWDRSLIYFATEFGRDKTRPNNAGEWGTGHDLNNGYVMVSPRVNGNTILGGVNPDTGMTYGFDPLTGDPRPGENMAERHIFAGVLQALGVDTSGSGLPNMQAMLRG